MNSSQWRLAVVLYFCVPGVIVNCKAACCSAACQRPRTQWLLSTTLSARQPAWELLPGGLPALL